MKLEVFDAGDVIFNHGDSGNKFYIILKGKVSVSIPRYNN
jgi:CRP-like cAMP-binding protein